MKPTEFQDIAFRELHPSDANLFYNRAFGVEEVVRHLQWDRHISLGETDRFLEEMIRLHDLGEKYFWVALNRGDGRALGLGSLRPDSITAWVGFLVMDGEQRNGFGRKIVRALEEAVFQHFQTASAAVAPGNKGSIALLLKCGWFETQDEGALPLLTFRKERGHKDAPLRHSKADVYPRSQSSQSH